MIAKGRTGLWVTSGGLMVWIALNRLAAYYGLSDLFWVVCGIAALLGVVALCWSWRIRREPDPGEEEKIAA